METDSKIKLFSTALDAYPPKFGGNRLNLLFVDEATPILAAKEYLHNLDAPVLLEERREYLLDEGNAWPFPCFHLTSRPDPYSLSDRLFDRFDEAARILPTQREIATLIEQEIQRYKPSIVALVIVDGLSYYDLPEEIEAIPCLVEGVTITEYGYRQAVGKPTLSQRLFVRNYTQQLGFTYFADSNDLAGDLHDTFAHSQRIRVRSFDEILDYIKKEPLSKAYLQITLSGLDQICHSHHDRPPRDHYLQIILDRYQSLLECLQSKASRVLCCLTADHGIMWKEHTENSLEIVNDIFQEDVRSPRYIRGSLLRSYGKCCVCDNIGYTLLRFPIVTRGFRNNEWGMHGGISAWESLVPLLMRSA
jgi:hypothetical protein